jgi:hypothetical protein
MNTPTQPAAVLGAVLATTGLDVDTDRACAELNSWMTDRWPAYLRDPGGRRSSLTESGAPFELSVKVAAGGGLSIRYVVDVADPTVDLAGNVDRYLDAAARATGQSEDLLRRLFASHLHDAPPGTLANVMVGIGWGSGNRRRSTLYLPAGWIDGDEIDERLPGPTGLDQAAQVVGYDFVEGALACWKTYHWFPVDPGAPLAARPTETGLPILAVEVHDQFAAGVPEALRERATLRQRRFGPDTTEDRLFLFTRPWGLADGPAVQALLALLAGAGLDLAAVRAVAQAGRDHALPMHVGLVSVGGVDVQSATFYFWPQAQGETSPHRVDAEPDA